MLIGVVSDTHGFYDPRVPPLLNGVEHILHAGDIGTGRIIEQLSEIAPVTAVRGNNDREGPESQFSAVETLELGGCRIYLTHIVKVPKVRRRGGTGSLSQTTSRRRRLWPQSHCLL